MPYLTDLADACRKSGLKVVEVPNWKTRGRPGAFDPQGLLCHHTGSYDEIGDTSSDLAYAKWLAEVGRSDLSAPLCQLALSAESVVYVCAAGRANHAGTARASGPMPSGDGNTMYAGIEAMNSGSQGWGSIGTDVAGNKITQREGYVRLCAAVNEHYGWPASHTRAHRETSVTGKPDPGLLDMDPFRADIAALIEGDDMADSKTQAKLDRLEKNQADLAKAISGVLEQSRNQSAMIRRLGKAAGVDVDKPGADQPRGGGAR